MYKSINIKILQISKNLQILQMNGNLSWMRSQIEMKYPGYSVLVPAHWAQYEQVFVCYFLIYFLSDPCSIILCTLISSSLSQ